MGVGRVVGVAVVAVVVVVVVGGGGCEGGTRDGAGTGAPGSGAAGEPGGAGCPADNDYPVREIAGTPGVLWALLFFPETDGLPAGRQTKIALKVTGTGELTLRATGPDDVTVRPEEFDQHDGSNWTRPGDEWGTYWVFPTPGCWTIRADRADGTRAALSLRAG
ncbi:hypothetical protein GA0074696_1441 [Micromonospora purpureochromogenes]|uniref:Uncharacterized protein n=1 Tax=Micromonospora purpureochromogenes TaxID=47872 RepID=A0A1C4VWT0_9ACTN|nr:hypothetical protein [Micromonospora purpureochromogenes]SCE88464.1 hypothetical protein GA0074696_1441 [Micromonospora purpureochromogenes]